MFGTIINNGELKDLIVSKGLKPTAQRIMILEYLARNTKKHPTAEQIHDAMHKKTPTLSLATVYNTLNSFAEAGLVTALTITGTEVRYEYATAPHHHLLCKHCGKIIDIDIECPNAQRKNIDGYRVDEVHGYFKGICRDCMDKEHKQ